MNRSSQNGPTGPGMSRRLNNASGPSFVPARLFESYNAAATPSAASRMLFLIASPPFK
ncbi:MAG TPA: hypothetical protein VGQ56_10475 [Gemmatimonadaceae bacterium]|nr:hypothetical protein [Gemmatimonadaceae bacterium]